MLVDKNYKTFKGMHAGGLVYINGKLHVPDTRKGKKVIYVFSLDKIKKIPKNKKSLFYNYKYVLQEERSYKVSIKPSFMSYDYDKNKVLIGEFNKCSNKHTDSLKCTLNKNNRLSWYTIGKENKKLASCAPYFSEMQGAVSFKDPVSSQHFLFTTSSYGIKNESHLHITNISSAECYTDGSGMTNYRELSYPPGLEDMHVSKDSKNVWMLTEFGPNEGSKNNRVVFTVKTEKLVSLSPLK